jgi:hypothetical protein
MSNVARAVTRTRRASRWWKVDRLGHRRPSMAPARYRTPAAGRPLPQFKVTRPAPKRRGGQAQPMGPALRAEQYWQQTGSRDFTPAQFRRWQHKYNRINDPRGLRGDAS